MHTFSLSLCSLTLSSSAQLQSMLIMHSQVCIETHRHAHARPHTHTHRGTHTHTQAYASRLFSIQQSFAHCSPRVTRSTSSIPDRLNMERMADEQSQKCIHTHHPQKYVKTQTHFRYSCMQRRTPTS